MNKDSKRGGFQSSTWSNT